MENASKALIMAAVILIGVVILSLGVYLFTYFGSYAKGVEEEIRDNQVSQFNSQFLSYEGKELTIYDVITLANMARDYNKEGELEQTDRGYITIDVSGISGMSSLISSNPKLDEVNDIGKIQQNKSQWIYEQNSINLLKYFCKVNIDKDTALVDKIKIQLKN